MDKLIDSGRITYRNEYLKKNPKAKLLKDCTDVVVYSDGSFIQILSTGIFYLNSRAKDRSLEKVEQELLKKINNKLNDA